MVGRDYARAGKRENVALTTEQMLVALEEMPPETGYATMTVMSGVEAALCLCRAPATDDVGYYLIVVPMDENGDDTMRRFIGSINSREALLDIVEDDEGLIPPRGIWVRDDSGATQDTLMSLREDGGGAPLLYSSNVKHIGRGGDDDDLW